MLEIVNRAELADFLRRRRAVLQPADVGRSAGVRRRTPGLRREEVAALAGMSTDYYTRLEQGRGPHPSTQVLAALARALRLTGDERDHLYRLAGQEPPTTGRNAHVRPGLLRLLDRLADTPAQVISDLAEVLVQNDFARALLGDHTRYTGPARSSSWRWFTDPTARAIYPAEDHAHHSRVQVANLRATAGRRPNDRDVVELVTGLRAASPEFAELWDRHDVAVRRGDTKRIVHPLVGVIAVHCEVLLTEDNDQRLLMFSPVPDTDAVQQLELVRVVGMQDMSAASE